MTDEALSAIFPDPASGATLEPQTPGSVDVGVAGVAVTATPHRYLCVDEIPGFIDPRSGHRHICKHEVDPHSGRHLLARVEHECGGCTATWTQLPPKPVNEDDLPWIGPFTWLAWKCKNGSWPAITFVAVCALAGLMCAGSLLGEGLGWW